MKIVTRILVFFLLLTIFSVGVSFFIPGRLNFVDRYSISIEKGVIGLVEKLGTKSHRKDKPDPFTSNAVTFSELTPYLADIKPGTLFFSDHGGAVTSLFISGKWKHCGIYIGTRRQIEQYWGGEHEVVRSLSNFYSSEDEYLIFDSSYEHGVAIHSIKEIAGLSDFSTLRELLLMEYSLTKEEWGQLLLGGMEHLGKDYDYCFVLDNDDALYCSEFLYTMLPGERNSFLPSKKILGRDFLLPSDLVQSIYSRGVGSGDFILRGTIIKREGQISPHSLQ